MFADLPVPLKTALVRFCLQKQVVKTLSQASKFIDKNLDTVLKQYAASVNLSVEELYKAYGFSG